MDIRPILSTLRRHKTAAALIVLEIALTCAIVCNALFLIGQRIETISQPSGIAEKELLEVRLGGIGKQVNAEARTREDLAALRSVPGVKSVVPINQLPFRRNSWNTGLSLVPDQERQTLSASQYFASEGTLDTMGLELIGGRDFQPDEYQNLESVIADNSLESTGTSAILSQAAALKLFPDGSALGKTIYSGRQPLRVVGVVKELARPSKMDNDTRYSMILPLRVTYVEGFYLIRVTDPARRDEVLKAAVAALEKVDPSRLVRAKRSYEEQRNKYFANDRAMVGLLVTVCVALLVVTALGIIGLASFWVQQRTKQIGIRRALGATRGQILRYFQTENFLLATVGIVLGMLMAYSINLWLMNAYELPRMPISYLPIGALLLWLLGQIAVFGPAHRAAAVPPAVATRSA
ncbi:ABC transporter permease [Stenotrophomonas rhizophila]|uniref:ABC transporter permease n=1 Tax=Stenotrophomonas rhizophila TaxID=216778 RepID=UPI001E3598F1|nr:FtsX-like permease family protein [Stenotrophomonas rhizophila]MCC7633679.1 ABC transporter permease [Stenotrophomonas rhizophila]MCC7663625.1 ABC transporter permease [Stenotrophomonas rhizophila]